MKKGSGHKPSCETRNLRGIELADRGWFDEALREFSLAIETDPRQAYPWLNRANVFLLQQRPLEALQDLLAAHRLAPGDSQINYQLASCLARHGNELSCQLYQRAIAQEPENIDARVGLALAYADQGEYDQAEKTLHEALELAPADPLVLRELGALKLDCGRVHEAIVHLRRALDAWPEDIDTLLDLAAAYIQAGFYDQAEGTLKRALVLDGRCLHALYNLAALYAGWGRHERCRSYLTEAWKLDPEQVAAWLPSDRLFDSVRQTSWFESLSSGSHPAGQD